MASSNRRLEKLENEDLNELHYSTSRPIIRLTKSRRTKWVGHGAGMGENINTHKSLVGKREGERPMCITQILMGI